MRWSVRYSGSTVTSRANKPAEAVDVPGMITMSNFSGLQASPADIYSGGLTQQGALAVTTGTRKSARFDVSLKITVTYQLNCQRHPPQEGTLRNISESGLCLQTAEPLPKDAVVFVDLELPGSEEKVRAIGKVVWSKPNGEAGVELGYIPAKQFKFLAPFLQAQPASTSTSGNPPRNEKE